MQIITSLLVELEQRKEQKRNWIHKSCDGQLARGEQKEICKNFEARKE